MLQYKPNGDTLATRSLCISRQTVWQSVGWARGKGSKGVFTLTGCREIVAPKRGRTRAS